MDDTLKDYDSDDDGIYNDAAGTDIDLASHLLQLENSNAIN